MAWTTVNIPNNGILDNAFFEAVKDNLLESGASKVVTLGDIIYSSGRNAMEGRLAITSGQFGNYVVSGPGDTLQWSEGVGNLSWRNYVTNRTVFFNSIPDSSVIAKAAGVEFLEARARNEHSALVAGVIVDIRQSELDNLLSRGLMDSDGNVIFQPRVRHYSIGSLRGAVVLGTNTTSFSFSGSRPPTWTFDDADTHRIGFIRIGDATGIPEHYILDVRNGMRLPDFEPLAPTTVSNNISDYRPSGSWFIRSSDFESLSGSFSFEGYTSSGALGTVTGVTLTGNANTIGVTWNDVSEATEYHVQWRTRDGVFVDSAASRAVVGETYTITGLSSDTLYYVRVRAQADNYIDSRWSDEESISTEMPTLGRVTGLSIGSIAQTTVSASWDAVTDATSYELWVGTSSGGSDIVSRTVTGTTYRITGLSAGIRYYVQVRAKASGYNDGLWSSASSFVTLVPQLASPTGVAAASQSSTSIKVSWNAVTNATGYVVSWEDDVIGTTNQSTRGGTARSYTITGLVSNRSYTIGVQAVSSSVDYSDSDWVYVTESTDQSTLGQVTGVSVGSITTSGAVFTWDAVTSATGYEYQWRSASQSYSSTRRLGVTGTSASLASLSSGTTYYVQVRATASGFTAGPWSAEVSFTVGSPTLGQVTGVSLTFLTTTQRVDLTATFSAVTSATSYTAETSSTSDFSSDVARRSSFSSGEAARGWLGVSPPADGSTWYVRIRARASGFTDGPWSDTARIAYSAPTPTLGQVTGLSLTFDSSTPSVIFVRATFDSVTSATHYYGQISSFSDFRSFRSGGSLRSGEAVGTWIAASPPAVNSVWYVRIRARALGYNEGPWSDTVSITYRGSSGATSSGDGAISAPNLAIQGAFFAYTIDDKLSQAVVPPQPHTFRVRRDGTSSDNWQSNTHVDVSWSIETGTVSSSDIGYQLRYRNAYVDNGVGSRNWRVIDDITTRSYTLTNSTLLSITDPSSTIMVPLIGDNNGSVYDLGWWLEVQVRAINTNGRDAVPVADKELYYSSPWTPSYYINLARR